MTSKYTVSVKSSALFIGLLCLSLVLTYFSLPGNKGFAHFVWFAIAPIFWLMERGKSGTYKSTLLLGIWGLFWWCCAIWWVIPAGVKFIGAGSALVFVIWFLACLALSIPYFIAGYLWRFLSHRNIIIDVLAKSATLTSLVGLCSWIIPANLAHSLFEQTLSIQIVSYTGISGLLFVVVLCNLALAKGIQQFLVNQTKPAISALTLALASFLLLQLMGYSTLKQIDKKAEKSITVAYIQPNLKRGDTVNPLIEQTIAFIENHPKVDLIAWPEVPIVFSWQERRSQKRLINNMLQQINKPLLLNSSYIYPKVHQKLESGKQYYNTAQLISADGDLMGNYHKQILVPFFEYLPFEAKWPLIRSHFPHSLRYIVGPDKLPIELTQKSAALNDKDTLFIAPLICYEMIFSPIPRYLKNQQASIFVNPSNDTWFGDTAGSIRHFSLALFRSVENRTPWVRVNNSGISGATTAYGQIIENSLTELNTQESKVVTLATSSDKTFYSRFGDVFLYFIAFFSLLFLIRRWKAR